MSTAIKVENLSKAYQLGEFGTGTISRDIERFWAKLRGKEDPFLTIGEANDHETKGASDIVWSLRDINFEISQGDTVGIIGRNGAGKSTLLKVLSRVTAPTTGSVKIKGRVASLLEVGTGFHPELTGRENIFLNGAILGMRKAEIKRRFDEIVDFAGVERYIDTPVKRYSSGMYVRLAFGVAAHLESEILVVDEVLAVGDAEFQKKCLGKMSDVSRGEGRTVLFVSHNMGSVKKLCDKGILLNNGQIAFNDTSADAIDRYMKSAATGAQVIGATIGTLKNAINITEVAVNNSNQSGMVIMPKHEIEIRIRYRCLSPLPAFRISCALFQDSVRVLTVQDLNECQPIEPGLYESRLKVKNYFLRPGTYSVSVGGHNTNYDNFSVGNIEWLFAADLINFEILEEWGEHYDFNNIGLVNLQNTGERKLLEGPAK